MDFLTMPQADRYHTPSPQLLSTRIELPAEDYNTNRCSPEMLGMHLEKHYQELARSNQYIMIHDARSYRDSERRSTVIELRYKAFNPADVAFDKQLQEKYEFSLRQNGMLDQRLVSKCAEAKELEAKVSQLKTLLALACAAIVASICIF